MSESGKMEVSKRNKLVLIAVAALLTIVLFVTMTLRFINNFSNALVEENSSYLAEITEHIAVNVEVVISSMQKSMEAVGLTISGGQQDTENRIYLNKLREKYNLEYVGVALQDGFLYSTMTSEEKNLSGEAYYQASMRGESVIEYVPIKIFENNVISGLLISAPIYNFSIDPEHPIGVLVAMLDMKKLAETVYISGFNGQGATYIINSEGEIVLQTKRLSYSNLYTTLSNNQFEKGYSLEQMTEDLNAQRAGFAVYSDFGVEKFMHYRHLGIADWSVVSIIEKNLITGKTTRLTQELTALGIAVIILFPLLLIFAISSILSSKTNKLAAQTKSAFLANMSHEIRTPMNAIVGIGQIMLREELTDEQKTYMTGIVNAGNGLLTIINDILDISKIESGKFNIVEEEYELESVIYDIVAVIAVRLSDKPIEFFVDVDPDLPKYLTGDMIRVKQVLTNIIGNAAKFTNSGYIRLGIHGEVKDGQIMLTMPVEDTGIGISKANLTKLFASFTQVDTHRNRNVEGTGLGLAISKQLCELMGGDINVESNYGAGSTFTIRVRQRVTKPEKIVTLPETKSVRLLLLEPSKLMQEHFSRCMNRLHLNYVFCESFDSFAVEAQSSRYTHALADPQSLHRLAEEASTLPELTPIALTSIKDQASMQDYGRTIIGPLFTLQLTAILSNSTAPLIRLQRGTIDILSIQPLPFVRVLLVDDNEVNLQVANGLMSPYHMQVDCAASGKAAIRMIEENSYDLVFMDHMMPEMDGVEALKLIRALNNSKKNTPVIALTANVTHGAQDSFIQVGFNGFLSKPIDTVRLNAILKKWLHDLNEAREVANPAKTRSFYESLLQKGRGSAAESAGAKLKSSSYIDFEAGLSKLGSREVYCSILTTYCRSAREKLRELPLLLETDLDRFTIEIHGLKGASGGVCAEPIALEAAKLEQLAKEKKLPDIRDTLPAFLFILQKALEEIELFIRPNDACENLTSTEQAQAKQGRFSAAELLTWKEAFWNFDSDKIAALLSASKAFRYDDPEQELLSKLKKCFDAYEFEAPVELIEDYEQKCPKGGGDAT